MILFLLALAAAGPLSLTPSPEATFQLLPTVQPGLAEVMVYDNHTDLRAQTRGRRFDGIRKVRATNMGGTWVINLVLEKPNQSLQMQVNGGNWVGTVVPHPAVESLLIQAPSLGELSKNPELVQECRRNPLPIEPLVGEDRSYGLNPGDFTPELPRWSEAEPTDVSWEAVDQLRNLLFVKKETAQLAENYYRLGALHRDLGHMREAAYYFGLSRDQGGSKEITELQRAGALLASRQWDAARSSAWSAWRMGAPEDAVLELLGVISLATRNPNAGRTALVMAHTTAKPKSLLLAGALLLESDCTEEAIPILRTAVQYLRRNEPQKASEARLMLADALILSGQMESATELLGQLTEKDLPPDQAGILRARNRLLALLRQTPEKWASLIPGLDGKRQDLSKEAAETLFLKGQVEELLGEDQAAIESYLNLVDHHRHLKEPASRLVKVWEHRTRKLFEEGKEMEAMELHAAVWRPSFSELVDDPNVLIPLAAAYRRTGLHYRAMSVLGLAAEVEGRLRMDDQETVMQIADLYLEMGHPDLSKDSLEVLRTRTLSANTAAEALLLEGRIAEAEGNRELARSRWSEAAKVPTVAVEAQARIGMMDASLLKCEGVLDPLAAALETETVKKRLGEGVLRTLYARCLGEKGNAEGSTVAAFQASEQLKDAQSSRYASWLSASQAKVAKVETPGGALESDPPDVWTLLSREETAQAAFEERLAKSQK